MKKIILIFLSILPLLFNCSVKEISKTDSWKEKYNIQQGTGMLYGKFAVSEKWAKINSHFYYIIIAKESYLNLLKKQKAGDFSLALWEQELQNSQYDSLSVNDSLLVVKNITPGDYVMVLRRKRADNKYGGGGLLPLARKFCNGIIIPIRDDKITLFTDLEKLPGELPVDPGFMLNSKRSDHTALDTCRVNLKLIQLNKSNYFDLIKRR